MFLMILMKQTHALTCYSKVMPGTATNLHLSKLERSSNQTNPVWIALTDGMMHADTKNSQVCHKSLRLKALDLQGALQYACLRYATGAS